MNETNVIDEYSRRSQFARISQWLALAALLISLSCFWLTGGAFGTLVDKIFWILGGLLLVAFLALGVLSVDRYRCPYCSKSLGVVRAIAYCPYCGIQLQSGGELQPPLPPKTRTERRELPGGIGAGWTPSVGISRRAASGVVRQGSYRPLASDFPEETYPKNIRMFTTSDETELTRRYFRLIAKDENADAEEMPAPAPGINPEIGWRLGKKSSEDSPRWRNKEKRKIG
jgi:hypothetical protein